ncbi:hypothetical protein NMY22_g14907 [Coprinellus aureogranulatus]|nr:hypothetical protein NMY22_g14907 [Coprinellus aureogranulatus]
MPSLSAGASVLPDMSVNRTSNSGLETSVMNELDQTPLDEVEKDGSERMTRDTEVEAIFERGVGSLDQYEETKDQARLTEAISELQKAVDLATEEYLELPKVFGELGVAYTWRYRQSRDPADISGAVSAEKQAVLLTPDGDLRLPARLGNLAHTLSSRFSALGDLSDLDEAISVGLRAVELTPEGEPNLPTRLSHLGVSYTCRFEQTGSLSDIAMSISLQQRAVHLTQREILISPCDPSDVSEAIAAHRKAVELTPEGDPGLRKSLNNLAVACNRRFTITGDSTALSEAISAQRKAVDLTLESHPELPATLNNLGVLYRHRFGMTNDLSDIDDSISVLQRGVQLTPKGHGNLPGRLSNLGNSYVTRFEHTGDLSDIAKAISVQRQAVEATPEGHAERLMALSNLGGSYTERCHHTGSMEDFDEAIANLKAAATYSFGSPHRRLNAARSWARMSIRHTQEWENILPAFDTVIHLVALVAGLEKTVESRYTLLRNVQGLASNAAAAACSFDKVGQALEWLEQGRCLVWGQLGSLRTPLGDLHRVDTELAERIEDVSIRLQTAGGQGSLHPDMPLSEKMALEDNARRHLNLANEWEDLLKAVRSRPGFETFLQPPACSALLHHIPESGAIVVINVEPVRCDAFALIHGSSEPVHIELPGFSLEKAQKYRKDLGMQLRLRGLRVREGEGTMGEPPERAIGFYRKKQVDGDARVVRNVLKCLWEEIVQPILNALGFSRSDASPTDSLPRVWWCPTGPLSFLPLHAAGIYGVGSDEGTSDFVVSSYTPTVTAITERVKNARPMDGDTSGLFLTCQPKVPGSAPIPGTASEVRLIYEKAEGQGITVLKLEGNEVSADKCLEQMERFSIVHLACHASQVVEDPLQSRFLFHEGTLDLAKIMNRNLKNADLAFLSACQTSTGEDQLSDEAVHLAGGMLAAGYRRVVATMWAIGDRHAPEVANDFYEYLWKDGEAGSGGGFSGERSAYALHHAIRQLRQRLDDSEESLLTWIPYVHFGY